MSGAWGPWAVGVVARYWPNVYSSAGTGVTFHDAADKPLVHAPMAQGFSGFFGNVLVGWAFDL